ncbi:hypothetical protein [Microbacterium sp. PMB16]
MALKDLDTVGMTVSDAELGKVHGGRRHAIFIITANYWYVEFVDV